MALRSQDVDLKLISLCFGNCDTVNSLRNILSLFHVLEKENEFREKRGLPKYTTQKPKIAVGMTTALDGTSKDATDIHGNDGLGGVHDKLPHYTASQAWIDLFAKEVEKEEKSLDHLAFTPSKRESWHEILDILRTEPEDSVIICAVGPLGNVAQAAMADPDTFARVKSVVSMGAAIDEIGNVTPLAEFNVYSDPLAAALVYALTAPYPKTTLPPNAPATFKPLPRPLDLCLFPLDITHKHYLTEKAFKAKVEQLATEGSPLAEWVYEWLKSTFTLFSCLVDDGDNSLHLHDPLAVQYALTFANPEWQISKNNDIRVETMGQWTRGYTVRDRRNRPVKDEPVLNDFDAWLWKKAGNRVGIAVKSPHGDGPEFGDYLLKVIFN